MINKSIKPNNITYLFKNCVGIENTSPSFIGEVRTILTEVFMSVLSPDEYTVDFSRRITKKEDFIFKAVGIEKNRGILTVVKSGVNCWEIYIRPKKTDINLLFNKLKEVHPKKLTINFAKDFSNAGMLFNEAPAILGDLHADKVCNLYSEPCSQPVTESLIYRGEEICVCEMHRLHNKFRGIKREIKSPETLPPKIETPIATPPMQVVAKNKIMCSFCENEGIEFAGGKSACKFHKNSFEWTSFLEFAHHNGEQIVLSTGKDYEPPARNPLEVGVIFAYNDQKIGDSVEVLKKFLICLVRVSNVAGRCSRDKALKDIISTMKLEEVHKISARYSSTLHSITMSISRELGMLKWLKNDGSFYEITNLGLDEVENFPLPDEMQKDLQKRIRIIRATRENRTVQETMSVHIPAPVVLPVEKKEEFQPLGNNLNNLRKLLKEYDSFEASIEEDKKLIISEESEIAAEQDKIMILVKQREELEKKICEDYDNLNKRKKEIEKFKSELESKTSQFQEMTKRLAALGQ